MATGGEGRTVEAVAAGALAGGGAVSTGRHARAAEAYSAVTGAGYRIRTHEEWEGFVSEDPRDPLALAVSREAGSAFLQELARAGGRVVDRATAVRLSASPSGDPLASETAALASKADLLIEVGAVAEAGPAGRLTYRIDIRSLRDGLIVDSFTTEAEPRPGADAAFTTAPGLGYMDRPGQALGQELAWQAMETMARAPPQAVRNSGRR